MHVFDDPWALFKPERTGEEGEQRWQALGLAGAVALLLVAYVLREEGADEIIRLISARRATRTEGERYEEARAQDAG
jgi:hypothetical protein